MNKPVAKVLKSKSSNSTIAKTKTPKDKKSKSSADFQTSVVKKRGVYVENNDEHLNLCVQVATHSNKLPKSPPKPRPDKKRFLTSVLTILSKCTVGIQHPGIENKTDIKNLEKQKTRKKKFSSRNETSMATIKEKNKYKSRALNLRSDDKLITLQSTKDIIDTPSVNSEQSRNVVNNTRKPTGYLEDYLRQSVTSAEKPLAREVLKGKQNTKVATRIDNDPPTLVADINNKYDKGLYNFFIDLLGTTASVYNLKTESKDMLADVNSSKLNLEIHESVAEKLNILDTPKENNDTKHKLSKCFHCIPNAQGNWDDTELNKHFSYYQHTTHKDKHSKTPFKRKLKANSKRLLRQCKTEQVVNKRKTNKANRKKSLLDSLKEQLRMEADVYDEPQNIFAALKLIAKNKRRYQKSTRFQQQNKDGGNTCRFKRRKLIATSTGSTTRQLNPEGKILRSTITPSYRNEKAKADLTTECDRQSRHSLQVYGFDDATDGFTEQACEKQISLTYHSSSALSDNEFDANGTILKYTDSDTS